MKPVIVVIAYNREKSLQRLLTSIENARYQAEDVRLIISIDKSDNDKVRKTAEAFRFSHGTKEVLCREENMGLYAHVLDCSALSKQYGSAIILEDDLVVAPDFYDYATQALEFSEDKDYIAGVSLYNHMLNVHAREPFEAVKDGFDGWYFQFASSWGQAFTKKQWQGFEEWIKDNRCNSLEEPVIRKGKAIKNPVPANVCGWGEKSWLKYYIRYVIETNKFFLYPHVSRSTNFSEEGTHQMGQAADLQVPLSLSYTANSINYSELEVCESTKPEKCGEENVLCKDRLRFPELNDTVSIYDAFFENIVLKQIVAERINESMPEKNCHAEDILIDLYGYKENTGLCEEGDYAYILSGEGCGFEKLTGYARQLRPVDANIFIGVQGEDFVIYDTSKRAPKEKKSRLAKLLYNYRAFKAVYGLEILKSRIFGRIKKF